MKMKEIFIAAILVITVIASIALIVNATNTISYTLFGRIDGIVSVVPVVGVISAILLAVIPDKEKIERAERFKEDIKKGVHFGTPDFGFDVIRIYLLIMPPGILGIFMPPPVLPPQVAKQATTNIRM